MMFLIAAATAQDNPPPGERLEALKVAFLTRKLNLSSEEAQRFWPVYNKYTEEIRKTQREVRESNGNEIEGEEKILNIRKKYSTDFTKVLGAEKTNELFRAEREFRGMVQREMMNRQSQRPQNQRRFREK